MSLVAFDRAVFFVKDRLPKQLGTSFDRMIKPAAPRGHRVMGIDAGQGIECTQILNRWVAEKFRLVDRRLMGDTHLYRASRREFR